MTANRAIVEIGKVFGQNLKKSKKPCIFFPQRKFHQKLFAGQLEGSFDKPGKDFPSGSPKILGSCSGKVEKI